MLNSQTLTYKIIMAGNKSVGKTSILLRYINDQFSTQLYSTIGMDFKLKTIQYHQHKIKLQIWDTAGCQTFKSILSAYYQNADVIILVFDNSDLNQQSYYQLTTYWIQQVNKFKSPNCQIVLLANKSDLPIQTIPQDKIKNFCYQHQITIYKKTSAKTGQGINQTFQQIITNLIKKVPKQKTIDCFSLQGSKPISKKKKNICCI